MRILFFAFSLLSLTATAQQSPTLTMPAAPAAKEPHTYISATEIAERIAKADAAAKGGTLVDPKRNGATLPRPAPAPTPMAAPAATPTR